LAQKAAAAAFQQELEQMAQAKDALAQELSTAQQQVALAQKAAAAAFQQGLDLDAQPKQHNAQRLSIAHLTDAVKSKDWDIQALSVQCCAANAGMLNTTISALLALPGCFTVQFHYLFTDTLHELSTLDGFNYASLQSMLHVLLAVEPSMLPT